LDSSYTAIRYQTQFKWHAELAISWLYYFFSIAAPASVNQSGIAYCRRHIIQQQAWNGNLAFARSRMFDRACHVVFFVKPLGGQTEVLSNLTAGN